MSRFDYVKYDEQAIKTQNHLKEIVEGIEAYTIRFLGETRATALAMTALEVFYMWMGKAIRDDQIKRNGEAELQEERTNS